MVTRSALDLEGAPSSLHDVRGICQPIPPRMRSIVIVLAVALWIASPLDSSAQELTYRLKIGAAGATLSGSTEAEFDPRTSLTGGFGFGVDFGNGLAVTSELLYVTKGAYVDTDQETVITLPDGSSNVNAVPVRARFDLTYIEIPFLLSYRIGRGTVRPVVMAGPSIAYNVIAQVNVRARGQGVDGFSQSYSDDTVESFDYGFVVGAGAEFMVSGERVVVESRLTLGQANVRGTDPALNNRSVLLLVGLAF